MRRSAAVLLPISSLYGEFGIGVLGAEAVDFLDFLDRCGFRGWQILPVEHPDESFSPYKSVSAFAGNPLLIDPRRLLEMGLISAQELDARAEGLSPFSVDYHEVSERQTVVLKLAYSRLQGELLETCEAFEPSWLANYALYMALREDQGGRPWFEWEDTGLRRCETKAVEAARVRLSRQVGYYRFTQWLFYEQWQALRNAASERGISIIGDMPMYISEDSADVWAERGIFEVDDAGELSAVAGVPPDYYAQDGQRWGNPLYNWEQMSRDNYAWWVRRMRESIARYDLVRIDHFRAFQSYYAIPADSLSARDGQWLPGPGIAPFRAMEKALGELPVFAEDLGLIDKAVYELRDSLGFIGMRVLQFGFLGEDGGHLPHQYTENIAAYTGTHDNTTLLACFYDMDDANRDYALRYCGFDGDWTVGGPGAPLFEAWFRMMLASRAALVVTPIQDMLCFGADTRTNVPGTATGNWRFRVTRDSILELDTGHVRELLELFDRTSG